MPGLGGIVSGAIGGGAIAGPAGAAVGAAMGAVGTAAGALKEAMTSLEAKFTSLKTIILDTVGAFRPFAVVQFTRAVLDLKATFGQIFLPILQEATALVRQFANYIFSLPSSFKAAIALIVKMTVLAGAISAVVGVIGTLVTGLGFVVAIGAAVAGALKYLRDQFMGTVGGASAAAAIFAAVEDTIGGLIGTLRAAWAATAEWRAQLSVAFDELGKALKELFTELRPIIAAALGIMGTALVAALKVQIAIWQGLTRIITHVTRAVTSLIRPLSNLLSAMGISLPSQSRATKDAFGLGFGGATVSDPLSVYNKLTEEIARNSRPASPEETTAGATEHMASVMDRLEPSITRFLELAIKFLEGLGAGVGGAGLIEMMRKLAQQQWGGGP